MNQLTLLNSMAGADFESALDQHVAWHLKWLDLKESIYGKTVMDLTDAEAGAAAAAASNRGLGVYALSTSLFSGFIEDGENYFRKTHLAGVFRAIALAKILRPRFIRLIAAQTRRRDELSDTTEYRRTQYPWLIKTYGEAIDSIAASGFSTVIENEGNACIFSKPAEVSEFFEELGRRKIAALTWDVQNLWQVGTFPTLEVYEQLKPFIGYVHLKGGQSEPGKQALTWSTGLPEASWPVIRIVRQVIADGVSPIICINPSHGRGKSDYNYSNVFDRDIAFLRREIAEIER